MQMGKKGEDVVEEGAESGVAGCDYSRTTPSPYLLCTIIWKRSSHDTVIENDLNYLVIEIRVIPQKIRIIR